MSRYAFATSEEAARVTVIDVDRRQAVLTLPAGPGAHSLALTPDGTRLYIMNRRGRSITVIDPRAPAVAGTLSLAGDPLADVPVPLAADETGELHHGCVTPDGGRLFVANMGTGQPRGGRSVSVLDTRTLRFIARLEARAGAGHPCLTPDGRRLFVVNHGSPIVSVFDAQRFTQLGEVMLPEARRMGHGCSLSDDGAFLWTVSSSAGRAYAIDTARLAVAAVIDVGANSQDIALRWRDAFA